MSNPTLSPDQHPEDQESLNKLEKAISDNDPQFQDAIQDLTAIANENLNLELVDIDKVLEEEKSKSLKVRFRRAVNFVNAKYVKVLMFLKWFLEYFIKELLPQIISKVKKNIQSVVASIQQTLSAFKEFSRAKKIMAIVLFLGSLGASFYFVKMFKGGLIGKEQKPFIYSIEEISEKKYFFEKEDQQEDFYSSSRFNQNLISLRRMVVNIRKTKNSSQNPMGAFEFFLQGNSSDVMVEVKDRESEILDLFQGEIRTFGYDDLDNIEGKTKLTEKLKLEINQILVRGKINKIYYKNFVLKR
jgi:flagellar basal body-associated protein FliL